MVPVKKKICRDYFQKQIFLQGPVLKNKIFCRDQKLQNGSNHDVPRIQIITKMGSGTIFKNKKFCRDQKQIFFYRDQNLNGPYLQGRVQYLSPRSMTQNWSFRVPKSGPDLDKSVADFWMVFSAFSYDIFRCPILPAANKTETYFMGSDLFQLFEGYFHYKYRPCIRCKLSTEPENRV